MIKSKFLAHRGIWDEDTSKNSKESLFKALSNKFGIETDIRDLNGSLVISHDPATKNNSFPVKDLFHFYNEIKSDSILALNIKSDGLQELLNQLLCVYNIPKANYFTFDMSIPDLNQYAKTNISRYTRLSDIENEPLLIDKCQGIWLDDFSGSLNTIDLAKEYLERTSVAFVSPELHGRQHESTWHNIKDNKLHISENFLLCTDLPGAAYRFFKD